jgi:ADP-ribosylglycohydrolase
LTQISANNNEHFIDDSIRGAIWGQFVGDAFCLGSHWIYDLEELAQRFPDGPQGFDAPAKGHYHFGKRPGDLTHYGDGAMVLLRSLAEKDRFDAVDFGSSFVALFDSPNYSGYRDHATKETIANMHAFRDAHPDEAFLFQSGADDDQPATVSRIAPLAAFCYCDDEYLSVVERATLVCQNNRRAVAYAQAHAMILRELFLGTSLHDAVISTSNSMLSMGGAGNEVSEMMNEAMAAKPRDVTETILHFGQSCPLKSSFPAALQCALHHGKDFAGALRANAAAGGDSAGRAAMIGAWLGAAYGFEIIPRSWQQLLTAQKEISEYVEQVVALACDYHLSQL